MQGSNWIASNWWQVTLAAALVIGYIVVLATTVKENKDLKVEVSDLKKVVFDHFNQPGLHRGPDFELRMINMERQLENFGKVLGTIDHNVGKLLDKE